MEKKEKRVLLSIDKKIRIANYALKNSIHQAMKEFLVDREFIRYWIKQLSKLDTSKLNQTNIPLILEKRYKQTK